VIGEALDYYGAREQSMPVPPEGVPEDTMRQMEREIMLQLIDQRWREHLSEMDYLREGINLRSLGQKDPLTEWQRDGYEMFGQMMSSIDDDYVKYVMHTQVQVIDRPALDPGLSGAQYIAPEGPVLGAQAIAGALLAGPAAGEEVVFASEEDVAAMRAGDGRGGARSGGGPAGVGAGGADAPSSPGARQGQRSSAAALQAAQAAQSASPFEHAGRNDPCPCGSGKKFKFCHGK